MDENTELQIIKRPPLDVYERVARGNVKSVKIGTGLLTGLPSQPTETVSESQKSLYFGNMTKDVARKIMGLLGHDTDSGPGEIFDEANLYLSMELKFVRKTSSRGQNAINEIASNFRHLDDLDYEIQLTDGGRVKNADMDIKKTVNVQLTGSGLVDETDLYNQMHDFLIETLRENDER